MIITGKSSARRTFLRGVGTTLALPLLDAMMPAMAGTSAVAKPAIRLGFVYVPNGIIQKGWLPSKVGTGFEMAPIMKDWRTELVEAYPDPAPAATSARPTPSRKSTRPPSTWMRSSGMASIVRDWRIELIEAHPNLFHPPVGAPEATQGYPTCGDGWRDLLERLSARIDLQACHRAGRFAQKPRDRPLQLRGRR